MLTVTLWLGVLTAVALFITLRRIMSWRYMVRRAVWLDIGVTVLALWAFSGQGVTGTLTGVFTGLVFSVVLHIVHWMHLAQQHARSAITITTAAPSQFAANARRAGGRLAHAMQAEALGFRGLAGGRGHRVQFRHHAQPQHHEPILGKVSLGVFAGMAAAACILIAARIDHNLANRPHPIAMPVNWSAQP